MAVKRALVNDVLEICALGGLDFRRGGDPLTFFSTRKVEALLCYLAVTGRPHFRETLAGLLWGEATQANARAYLRQVLAELRRGIPSHLIITRQHVTFDRERPYWLDVEAFEQRITHVTDERRGALAEAEAVALVEAAELYGGDFLEGFYVRHAAAFEEWVLLERERLRLRALQALHALVDFYRERDAFPQAITHAGRLLALEPRQEEAHRVMMSLLAHSGQRIAALRQYEVCRQVLAQELGVAPDSETTALYEWIKAGQPADRLAGAQRSGGSPNSGPGIPLPISLPHNLPACLTPLIGRGPELAEIEARLQDPACRLLTLFGPGGCGKTRLALEAAADLVSKAGPCLFEHGVYFVSLGPLETVDAIVPTLARTLGCSFYKGAEPTQQLLDYVREKCVLLVLDGFEHLLDGTSLLTEILKAARGVKVLATSRTRLNLGFEYLLPILGLEYPAEEENGNLASFSGVQLFLSVAQRVHPGFERTAETLQDVAQICRIVEGMPLGILLAAGWTRMFSTTEIAARLCDQVSDAHSHGLDFLETEWRDVPARQRSMRRVFDHSWALLTEREQEVSAALSVFRAAFTWEAARHVASASPRELMALVDKSMLHRVASGRYEMHELLRQYASEKTCDQPDVDTVARDRHCAFYAAALQQWGADLKGPRQATALTEIAAESENARAAWMCAAQRGRVERLEQSMDGLCYFFKWRGRYQEGAASCHAAIDGLSAAEALFAATSDRQRVLAKALAWQGVFTWRLGDALHARQLLAQSLERLQGPALAGHDTRAEEAFVQWRMGTMLLDVDYTRARRLCERSLALYRALGDRWGMANVLDDLGELARKRAAFAEAQVLLNEGLALRQALGDQRGISHALSGLSVIAMRQGRFEEADRLMHESIALCRAMRDQIQTANRLVHMSTLLLYRGEISNARSALEESASIYRGFGVRAVEADINARIGVIQLHLGLYDQARRHLETGLALANESNQWRVKAASLLSLGYVALAKKAYAQACTLLRDSAAIFRQRGQRDELGRIHAVLACSARGLGDVSQARRYACEALQTGFELQAFAPLMPALSAIALLLADAGESERALELYALALRHPFVAKSRWFADVFGKNILTAAAKLPPSVAAAARRRGRARELWGTVGELLAEFQDSLEIPQDEPVSLLLVLNTDRNPHPT